MSNEREDRFVERLLEQGWLAPPDKPVRPWFQSDNEAIRWMLKEANQWVDDNPEVAAHLIECAFRFQQRTRGIKQ